MFNRAPPTPQGSGSSDGVLDPLAGVFQQALSLKFFHDGSGRSSACPEVFSFFLNAPSTHSPFYRIKTCRSFTGSAEAAVFLPTPSVNRYSLYRLIKAYLDGQRSFCPPNYVLITGGAPWNL